MRPVSLGAWLVIAIAVGAQTPDPADLMPRNTPIFIEARDPGALAEWLGNSAILAGAPADQSLRKTLCDLGVAGARRVALGVSPSVIGSNEWIAVVESADAGPVESAFQAWATEPIASTTVGRLVLVANGEKTLAAAAGLAGKKQDALSSRPDFKAFSDASPKDASVRFHLDLQDMWPRPLRQVKNSSNIWSVLLGCHVNHVLKTVGFLSGTVSTRPDGGRAFVSGDIRAPDSRAVTEGSPAEGVIAAPPGVGFRISVPRNLTNFWSRRSQLLPDAALTKLSALDARVRSTIPDWTVEKLVGRLGEAFDLYIHTSDDSGCAPGQRTPAMALVASAPDSSACEFEALKTFLRLAAAAIGGTELSQPVCEQARSYRGADLFVARNAAPSVITKVRGRVIVSNDEALTMRLVDSALERPFLTRAAGDDIVISGRDAARVIADAEAILATGWLAERLGSEARARAFLTGLEAFLPRVADARISFDLDGKLVKLAIEVSGPGLAAETRPAAR